MVEFCFGCKSSLPKADVTILNGRLFASHDYLCPFCHELACPSDVIKAEDSMPSEDQDLVIARGTVSTAPPPSD